MTKYISPIDQTVHSVYAHSIEFKAGEPTLAPPVMHNELVAKGIMPEDYVAPEVPEVPVAPAEGGE